MEVLTQHLAAVLQELLGRGFQTPILAAVISLNGSVLAGSFTPTGFVQITEHIVDDMFTLPVNMMFADGVSGEAARVVIERPDQQEYTIN